MNIIDQYYPNLSGQQREQFALLDELYRHWNCQINVISRKDIDFLYEHHVLHSLGILQMLRFKPESQIIDIGTGGGFPGIPLAIMFPDVSFLLVDSIGKKIKVASAVSEALGLRNVRTLNARVEAIKNEKFDFAVSRAVVNLPELARITKPLINKKRAINALSNGLICLKGGDIQKEITPFRKSVIVQDLYPTFKEEYFKTKKVVYLPLL